MFVTGLNTDSLIRREPALADFDPNYTTNFPDRINEAKAVIDNRLRASGYDLDKIGIKEYVWNLDNPEATIISNSVTLSNTNNRLLVCLGPIEQEGDSYTVIVSSLSGSNTTYYCYDSFTPAAGERSFIYGKSLPYVKNGLTVEIQVAGEGVLLGDAILCFFTDPAVYFVHLYKTLHLIYESFISEPGDLFERKAETYRMAYENEFNTMVTYYDRNGDGTTDENDGQRPMKQVRFMR